MTRVVLSLFIKNDGFLTPSLKINKKTCPVVSTLYVNKLVGDLTKNQKGVYFYSRGKNHERRNKTSKVTDGAKCQGICRDS